MPTIKNFDEFGYYYTFGYYLKEQELDYNVLTFLKNNEIEIELLICFFDFIKNNVHYIVATNKSTSYKVITISECDNLENLVLNNIVYYNGYKYTISTNMSLSDAEKMIQVTDSDIIKYDRLYKSHFISKNINKHTYSMNKEVYISNLRTLSVLPNCEIVNLIYIENDYNRKINKIEIQNQFPKLKIINYYGENLYERS